VNQKQRLLRSFVVPCGGKGQGIVVVEVVIVVHVGLDGVQIDVHIVELLHEEEARGHALSSYSRQRERETERDRDRQRETERERGQESERRGLRDREMTWDGVAFVSRGSNKLKALLSNFEMLSAVGSLAEASMDHTLQNIFLRGGGLNVFDELMSLVDVLMLEMVDDLERRQREVKGDREKERDGGVVVRTKLSLASRITSKSPGKT
jgi:hypothetical protein